MDHCAQLFHLVRFRLGACALESHSLLDIRTAEDVVTPARALLESQVKQQRTQIAEVDVGISPALKDSAEQLLMLPHLWILPSQHIGRALHVCPRQLGPASPPVQLNSTPTRDRQIPSPI